MKGSLMITAEATLRSPQQHPAAGWAAGSRRAPARTPALPLPGCKNTTDVSDIVATAQHDTVLGRTDAVEQLHATEQQVIPQVCLPRLLAHGI